MKSVDEQINEVERDLVELDISYQIWRALTNPDNRDKYEKTLDKYPSFFRSVIDAQFMSVVVVLNRLLEGSKKTINLFGLKSQIIFEITVNEKNTSKLESFEIALKESFDKLVILRSNVFAHRSKKVEVSDLYSRAGISPNFLDETIKNAQEFYNAMIFVYQNRTYRFDFIDFVETDELVKKLAEK